MHNQFCTLDGFDTFYDKVLHTYSELGYSSELVTHWALPRRDARKLLEQIIDAQPTTILEIGTFVGLTTTLHTGFDEMLASAFVHTIAISQRDTQIESTWRAVGLAEIDLQQVFYAKIC